MGEDSPGPSDAPRLSETQRKTGVRHLVLAFFVVFMLIFTLALCSGPR